MRSRWVVALVLMLPACGSTGVQETGTTPRPEQTAGSLAEPTADGSGGRPVGQWLRVGGLMAPGLAAVRPPMLVVYADGRAVADAARVLRLSPAETATLVKALEHDLAGQPATASPRPGTRKVYDAPTTVLGVDGGKGMREVRVPALEHAESGYDAALVTARDRLARLAARVSAQGRSYSADRVRLSAEQISAPETPAKPWPGGVPLPPETQARSGRKDYKGAKARTITRSIPDAGLWHVYRRPTGEHIALSWRYLLPHE
ncbi:hypothetical protein [Nonomuraea sp. NPDC048826]|uniref:hypothetical protein n=1 Tax=Nonomuraea sp. NPDC048826 TaxID=3364347 RepID=UPI00370FD6B8